MPVQPETELMDDVVVTDKPRRPTLASALERRERLSAFRGSRIHFDAFEPEVVEIRPYKDQDGTLELNSRRVSAFGSAPR
ncbi:hypothetical protein DSC91_007378 [Paraburkholderia caffeinilytica]|uniref:Uncharacterized protein n=2 Tax=Paraburkholderia caffeinilytica TaxID=1761016 RepID=A0ABQ1NAN4_9BURK|nr:hypothetical protein DSC91_007378 [Paraburkholderia caffeinilytica]GGC63471.1 hypothetical protein GCM10011400_59150 [Paraburkholderia caffeinilytica]